MQIKWAALGAPINCSGLCNGVDRMPAALRSAGLANAMKIRDAGDIDCLMNDSVRDRATGMIGFQTVCKASESIRQAARQVLEQGEHPLVVGGDCTLLIGVSAALRDHFGETGLVFIDGHLDFYDGLTSPTGEAADMELAILTGWGPQGLIDLAGPPPLVTPKNVAVLGYRDEETTKRLGAPDPEKTAPGIRLFDIRAVRRAGLAELGNKVAEYFAALPGKFWLHLDLDVLDEKAMPAVDYPMPGGLEWEELEKLLAPLTHSPALVGMDVAILNPSLDPDGKFAERTVRLLADSLAF